MSNTVLENVYIDQVFLEKLYRKKKAFEKHAKKIKTVAFSSSHLDYGFIPVMFDKKAFNFSFTSMDYFGMYHLLKYVLDKAPNVKNVVIGAAIFANGYDLAKTGEKWRCVYCKEVLGIPYPIDCQDKEFCAMNDQVKKSDIHIGADYYGFDNPTWFGSWSAEQRVQGHVKNFLRDTSQLKYLNEMYKLCYLHLSRC